MADVYQRVMGGSAVLGMLTAAGYLTASSASYADGTGIGVEIPPPVNSLCIIVIVCCTVTAAGAWLIRRDRLDTAAATDDRIQSGMRKVVDQAFADAMPLVVSTLTASLAREMDPKLHSVATAAANRTSAVLREAVTEDITAIVDGVYRRGQIAGAIIHSQTTGKPGLRPVKQFVTTSEGD